MIYSLCPTLLNVARRLTINTNPITSSFHLLFKPTLTNLPQHNFLAPVPWNVVPSCGFKVMGRVRRRCKDCYFVRRAERLYVICEKHPRHKQMSMVKDPKNTWMLSHATQGKIRPW